MTRSVVHDTFVIKRTYPASPARVFAAFGDAAIKSQWFGEPGGSSTPHELDFRVGGRESLRGQIPTGPSFTYDALYHDIVDGERIIYSYEMTMDGRRISVSVATIELAAEGDGTRFTLTQQGAFLDGLDTNAIREEGTNEMLDGLGRFLAESP